MKQYVDNTLMIRGKRKSSFISADHNPTDEMIFRAKKSVKMGNFWRGVESRVFDSCTFRMLHEKNEENWFDSIMTKALKSILPSCYLIRIHYCQMFNAWSGALLAVVNKPVDDVPASWDKHEGYFYMVATQPMENHTHDSAADEEPDIVGVPLFEELWLSLRKSIEVSRLGFWPIEV